MPGSNSLYLTNTAKLGAQHEPSLVKIPNVCVGVCVGNKEDVYQNIASGYHYPSFYFICSAYMIFKFLW